MFGCERRAELEDGFACDRRGSALSAAVTFVALLSAAFVVVLGHLFDFLNKCNNQLFGICGSLNDVLVLASPSYYDHSVLGC